MIDIEFEEAAVEVLDILSHMKSKDVERIPKKFIDFLEQHSSKIYKSQIDYTKPIEETRLKQKTYDLLGVIYLNYWADEEGKDIFLKKINKNEEKYQMELREKYNTDNILKNRNIQVENTNEVALVEYKESIFRKIINKIKYIFKKH